MDGNRPWSDLPRDIVDLIIRKLRFPDINCALAVCRSWRDCKDYVTIRCSNRRPWAVSYGLVPSGTHIYTVTCDLFDLYSQKVYGVSNSIQVCMKLNKRCTFGLVSRNGWILQGINGIDDKRSNSSSFFLHNPFTGKILLLPLFADTQHATMRSDPSSPECEIFVLSISDKYLSINTYCPSKENDECQSELVVPMSVHYFDGLHSVLYMNGNIYFVFVKGVLYSYNLKDKSWKLLSKGFPNANQRTFCCFVENKYLLLEINANIIMVQKFRHMGNAKYEWMIFRFDWSEMRWVVATRLRSRAIYISNNVAFSALLKNRYGEKLKGCMIFYQKKVYVADDGNKPHSLSEATNNEIQSDEFGWAKLHGFCFIEPPH